MRTEIGFIRPSRLARLRAKALRCRERWCYRAMVPIPPNGPSPPPFPFALVVVDSSSPPPSTFHTLSFFFSVLLPVSYRLSTSFYSFLPTFLISSSHSFLRLYGPFSFHPHPSYHRNFHEVQKKQSISESFCRFAC